MTQIIPTAEPFLLTGNNTGCLLVHGFTGTPKEMRWMGEYLNQRGYTCLGVRLAGHATDPEDMIRSRWTDWVASVEDGYHLLRGMTDRVFLIGLSMGGVLSLLMSTRLETAGVVAMSTPYRLSIPHYPDWVIKLYSWLVPFAPKSSEVPGASWQDKNAFSGHVSYPQTPIRSVVELKNLLLDMRTALPRIRTSVLLMHSKDDAYVVPENMEQIYAELSSASEKTKLYVSGSGHVVTRDAARGQVFEAALNFIRNIEDANLNASQIE